MAHAVVHSRALDGVASPSVEVEVDLAGGLPALTLVGLPETAVREAKDRVRAAIENSGFDFPTARVTVNLAPADLPKDGGRFDLPIALGILTASGQLPAETVRDREFLGELTLDGRLRPIRGVLAAALARDGQAQELMVPAENAAEAAVAGRVAALGAASLNAAAAHLRGEQRLEPAQPERR